MNGGRTRKVGVIMLDWEGELANGWACEHDDLCAWIEPLPIERRFAWTVDELDHDAPEQAIIVASGVAPDVASAKLAVAEAMTKLGAVPKTIWSAREDGVVIDLFPGRGRPHHRKP